MSQICVRYNKRGYCPNNITLGNTPMVSASANSLTIRGEGSNQTSIQRGLAKAWVSADGVADSLRDSFNVSTVTDGGTGIYEFPFTTNFASTNYSLFIVVGKVVLKPLIKCPHQTLQQVLILYN